MTLYLKYRSRNLDELDLPDVAESLKKIVESGKIPHAFLFAGPKGTGKTSAARILAKIVNCERLGKNGMPCDKCEQCTSITKGTNLDVIEMDAASHRGIDDVRVLRDAVKLAPTRAKKKVYIIDEAHMLTVEASNALLKTLEEPPPHVIFILATTNPEKLIETIKSRTTFIPFRKAAASEIVRSLKRVIAGEKIKISDEAIEVIAKGSDGAFRDAIKILDQLVSEKKELTTEKLSEFLFKNKSFDTDRFIELLIKKDTKSLIAEIGKLGPSGVTTDLFLESLLKKLRTGLLGKVGIGEDSIKNLSRDEIIHLVEIFTGVSKNVAYFSIEELPLELAVIKWCGESEDWSQSARLKQNSSPAESGTGHGRLRSMTSAGQDLTQTIASGAREQSPNPLEGSVGVNEDIWKSILATIKPVNASIEALLRAARPLTYDGKILTLGVFYKFHKERLEDAHHRQVLEGVITKVLKSPTRVICTLVEPPPKKIIEEAKTETVLTEGADTDIIKVAKEIFGN